MRRGRVSLEIVKSVLSVLISVLLMTFSVLRVGAANDVAEPSGVQTEEQEAPTIEVIEISDKAEFLSFAENCRIDSYSYRLKVVLTADIDLENESFDGIPIFTGEFEGNNHRITGLNVDGEGSVKGLFRYLTETALVQNLTVEGQVTPSGSACDAGGIAGNNAGAIVNCWFNGTVSGADNVGGIAGINEMSGIIEKCHVNGSVSGNHFVGGIVGNNFGVIRRGINSALINTTVEQSSVGISDITIESMMGAESVATVTDIGGVAGNSSGVLRKCINYGQIGYLQMGYNVGGIAGRQVGYVVDCVNYGDVYGRKEAGGIVGHQEPNVLLIYEVDTLQTLEEQLDTMQTLTNRASSNAQSGANKMNSQVAAMNNHAKDAQESVDGMKQMYEAGEYDEDRMTAYQNNLGESLKGMTSAMESMNQISKNTANTLNKNLQAINRQMDVINNTLDNAEEGLGGEVKDVSDADTEEITLSEVFGCDNYGKVDGDLNVGGIVGLIALETDLDSTEDVDISGELSMNFVSEMRSVVLENKNWGTVTVRKQYGGGIAGGQDMGLIKGCTNVGTVDGEAADFVGGIVGNSLSYIRSSNAKCVLKGTNNVGGIAGSGMVASDCLSMVEIRGGAEKSGAVFGAAEEDIKGEEMPITGNYYVSVGTDPGAIDGISYAECAEPMNRTEFLQMEDLPDIFKVVTVQFWAEDAYVDSMTMQIGGDLNTEDIPQVPAKEGMVGVWEGLEQTDLTEIIFDLRFEALYTAKYAAIESDAATPDGRPLVLALGEFVPEEVLTVKQLEEVASVQAEGELLDAWEYALKGEGEIEELRFFATEALKAGAVRLWLRDSLGVWREGSYTIDGSYILFPVSGDDDAFAFFDEANPYPAELRMIGGGAALLLIIIIFVGIRIRKKAKNKITES